MRKYKRLAALPVAIASLTFMLAAAMPASAGMQGGGTTATPCAGGCSALRDCIRNSEYCLDVSPVTPNCTCVAAFCDCT